MRLAVRSSTLRLRQLRLQLRRQSRALLHVLHRIPDAQELPHAQLIHESIAACFWRGRCVPLCERERENPPSAEGSARRCGFHRDQELRRQLAECTQHLRCTRVIVSRCVGRRDVLRAVAATREPQLGRRSPHQWHMQRPSECEAASDAGGAAQRRPLVVFELFGPTREHVCGGVRYPIVRDDLQQHRSRCKVASRDGRWPEEDAAKSLRRSSQKAQNPFSIWKQQ